MSELNFGAPGGLKVLKIFFKSGMGRHAGIKMTAMDEEVFTHSSLEAGVNEKS